MDSWRGYNYFTTNESAWIQYINRSTSDWNIGSLPPSVVAISGSLNESHRFPIDSLVIEGTGRSKLGQSAIEAVVYGIAVGLILLCLVVWGIFNRQSFFEPEKPEATISYDPLATADPETGSGSNTATGTTNGATKMGLAIKAFRDLLDKRYYEPVVTEIELYEKDDYDDYNSPEPADVESLTALMREVYRLDLMLWASQGARNQNEDEQEQLRDRSDAAWAEVRTKIERWSHHHRHALKPEEQIYLDECLGIVKRIPEKRYGERPGR